MGYGNSSSHGGGSQWWEEDHPGHFNVVINRITHTDSYSAARYVFHDASVVSLCENKLRKGKITACFGVAMDDGCRTTKKVDV